MSSDDLDRWAAGQKCPGCGHESLRVEWRLMSRAVGDYSLAGAQMKFSARKLPWLICDGCGAQAPGVYNDPAREP